MRQLVFWVVFAISTLVPPAAKAAPNLEDKVAPPGGQAARDIDEKLTRLMTIYGDSPMFPTEEQWRSLLLYPNKQPIMTVSFMQRATGEVHSEETGFRGSVDEALAKYIDATMPIIERIGVKPVFVSSQPLTIIGDESNQWDTLVVTEYPSAEAYIELHLDPEYIEKSMPYRRLTGKRSIMLVVQRPPAR